MNTYYKSMILGTFLALAGWAALPHNTACASSGTIAEQTCDTQVWQTMEARARIETEREIMQNQNLIFKPDSVLNYVCFDKLAGHAAANVGVLFTHTTYWDKEIIQWGEKYGVDAAINKTVINSLKPYLSSNFGHSYLGGRGNEYLGGRGGDAATPPTPVNSSKSSNYSCSEMAKIWGAAKCANFMHTANLALTDGFYPYLNLKAGPGGEDVSGYETKNDVRDYPTPCSGTPVTGSTWEKMYRISRNEDSFGSPNNKYDFGTPLQKAYEEVRDKIEPGACGAFPVSTGVTVILGPNSGGTTYQDGVCTNPGCTFVKGSGGGGGTCVSGGGGGGGRGTPPDPPL